MWVAKAGKINPLVWLGVAVIAMISVRTYDATAFLTGWLFCSVLIAGAILALAARSLDTPPLFLRIPGGIWVARAGVACYPIYLFQAFEKNLNSKIPWLVSLALALVLGGMVHCWLERKFYRFPDIA
jgi:peptidoglycan/LPS O-acetylase OafA/YrhL